MDIKGYLNAVNIYQKYIEKKHCPKCGKGNVSIKIDKINQSFEVKCNNCAAGHWKHFQDFNSEYNSSSLNNIGDSIEKQLSKLNRAKTNP